VRLPFGWSSSHLEKVIGGKTVLLLCAQTLYFHFHFCTSIKTLEHLRGDSRVDRLLNPNKMSDPNVLDVSVHLGCLDHFFPFCEPIKPPTYAWPQSLKEPDVPSVTVLICITCL